MIYKYVFDYCTELLHRIVRATHTGSWASKAGHSHRSSAAWRRVAHRIEHSRSEPRVLSEAGLILGRSSPACW